MPISSGLEEGLPDWYRDILRRGIERSAALFQTPVPVLGTEMAQMSPYTSRAIQLAQQTLGSFKEPFRKAVSFLEEPKGSYESQLQPYLNPYIGQVLGNIAESGMRTLTERILPALDAKFLRRGQHGSSRHADLATRAARDIQGEISRAQANALQEGFTQAMHAQNLARNRDIERSRLLGNLESLRQQATAADISLLSQIGQQEEARRQVAIDRNRQEMMRRLAWPYERTAEHLNLLRGLPHGGGLSFSYSPAPLVPQINPLGQMGGIASILMGMQQRKRGGTIKSPSLKNLIIPVFKDVALSPLKIPPLRLPRLHKKLMYPRGYGT